MRGGCTSAQGDAQVLGGGMPECPGDAQVEGGDAQVLGGMQNCPGGGTSAGGGGCLSAWGEAQFPGRVQEHRGMPVWQGRCRGAGGGT